VRVGVPKLNRSILWNTGFAKRMEEKGLYIL
jgi:hypothetical protein